MSSRADRLLQGLALLVPVAFYLQGSLVWYHRSSDNVSFPAFLILFLASVVYLLYTLQLKQWFFIASGVLTVVGALYVIVLMICYRPQRGPGAFLSHKDL
jgi:uncharacterized protein with PQ loop repeat